MHKFRTAFLYSCILFFSLAVLAVEFNYLFFLWTDQSADIPWFSICATSVRNMEELRLGIMFLFGLAVVDSLYQSIVRGLRQWSATRRLIRRLSPLPVHRLPPSIRRTQLGTVYGLDVPWPAAFTVGFLQPRIVVTAGLLNVLDEKELEAVLYHEMFHRKSRDPLKMWLAQTLARSFRYVPVIGEMARHYRLLRELMADEFVIRQMHSSRPLGLALLKMVKKRPPRMRENLDTVAALFTSSLDVRIMRLLDSGYRVRLFALSRKAIVFSGIFFVLIGMAASCLT